MIWQRFSSWPFADKRKLQSPLQFSAALRVLRGQMCCRCSSSCSFVALRGQKEVAVAVAVLRGPPCPPWTNVLPLQFFVALRGQKEVAVAVAVLRGPPCPPWTNVLPLQFFVWPFVDKRKLQSPLQFSAALRVLRGQMCCRCSSSCSFVALRGQKEVAVAVAVLRGPPCPPWTNVLPLQFFVALRGQKEVAVAVAVLRGPPCPPWTNVLPLQFFVTNVLPCRSSCSFVALRGQKEVAVAVAVLRGPPCPPWTNVLPLQFFVFLRGPSRTKGSCRCRLRGPPCPPWTNVLPLPSWFSAALRVLRGQMCCRCSSSWSFVDKRKLQSPLQFSAALRVLRGQMCCRCSSSWPFVDKRKLQSPLRTKGSCSRRCSSPRPSVSSVDKCAAVAVRRFVALRGQKKLQSPLQFSAALRVLRGQMCCRCSSSWPFVEKGFPPLALRGQTKL